MKKEHSIAIVGAGGIGRAVALILAETSPVKPKIYLGDAYIETAQEAIQWVLNGLSSPSHVEAFDMPFEGENEAMQKVLEAADIVLDCLPGSQAPRIARLAKKYGLHYANLTEYVKETNEVVEIAKGAETGFALQTGLAPGFINILAHALYKDFQAAHGTDQLEYMGMKVGALTQNAAAPHFYGFTWSPVGVATEYVKDAIAVRDFKKVSIPALSEQETIIIDGTSYEVDLTSGGAADLPDAFAGKIKNLDYKTIRFPGHYGWAKGILAEHSNKAQDERIQALQNEMESKVPHLENDLVVIHSNVIGKDSKGRLRSMEAMYHIYPQSIGKHKLRAIQTTTAVPLCEVARMLLEGDYKGAVFQSQLDPHEFMKGFYVSMVYK
jgi:saccharopine dehydrogenase-like NADP-dependent oxidoreductase